MVLSLLGTTRTTSLGSGSLGNALNGCGLMRGPRLEAQTLLVEVLGMLDELCLRDTLRASMIMHFY